MLKGKLLYKNIMQTKLFKSFGSVRCFLIKYLKKITYEYIFFMKFILIQ